MNAPARQRRGASRAAGTWAAALALVVLGALLYLPRLGRTELRHEEARRAIPAREMLASGDLVLPTIWGQPYLRKPPLAYWCIAAVSSPSAAVTATTARLPSVVATILTALVLLALGSAQLGLPTGLLSGACFLVTASVLQKGVQAEIEPLLGLLVLASTALAWLGLRGSCAAAIGASALLGLAVLTKGPVAWLFHVGAFAGLALLERDARWLWGRRARWILGASLVPVLLWGALLLARIDSDGLAGMWAHQLSGGAAALDPRRYLGRRLSFALAVLCGFAPASPLVVAALVSRARRRLFSAPILRLAGCALAAGLLAFLVLPRTQGRYAYPVIPWAALIAGRVLADALDPDAGGLGRDAARWMARCVGLAALALVVAAAVHRWIQPLAAFELDLRGWTLISLLLALGITALGRLPQRSPAAALALALAGLALGRVFQLLELQPVVEHRNERLARARALDDAAAPQRPLYTCQWGKFNLLFYVGRDVVYVDHPSSALAPGDVLLAPAECWRDGDLHGEHGWAVVQRFDDDDQPLILARRLAPPGAGAYAATPR